jgi:hypothetical protein
LSGYGAEKHLLNEDNVERRLTGNSGHSQIYELAEAKIKASRGVVEVFIGNQ